MAYLCNPDCLSLIQSSHSPQNPSLKKQIFMVEQLMAPPPPIPNNRREHLAEKTYKVNTIDGG